MTLPRLSGIILLLFTLLMSCGSHSASGTAAPTSSSESPVPEGRSEGWDSILSIYTDAKGGLWFITSNGGLTWEKDGERRTYQPGDGLPKGGIRSIEEDEWGDLLVASFEGVSRFEDGKFAPLEAVEGDWKTEAGDLWFAGGERIFRWDGKQLYGLNLPESPLEADFYARYPGGYNPYDNYVVCKDSKGNVWLGTSNLGVCRFDGKEFEWIHGEGLDASAMRVILEDRDGFIWFGNSGEGFYRYDGESLENYRLLKGLGNAPGAAADKPVSYMAAAQDSSGNLWVATYSSGIWRYDGEEAIHYRLDFNERKLTFYTLTLDRNGSLFVGSHEAGIFHWNGEAFEHIGH